MAQPIELNTSISSGEEEILAISSPKVTVYAEGDFNGGKIEVHVTPNRNPNTGTYFKVLEITEKGAHVIALAARFIKVVSVTTGTVNINILTYD